MRAAFACVELANILLDIDADDSNEHAAEALQWLCKGAHLVDADPSIKCVVLQRVALVQLSFDHSSQLLITLDEIWATATRIDQCRSIVCVVSSGHYEFSSTANGFTNA